MSSSNGYLNYILEQLSEAEDISHRAMMGEYILYCRGKVIGGIYDDRFLIKPTEHAKKKMPEAVYELPYEGAKEMLLVDNVEDKAFLAQLVNGVADELPAPKKKKK
ncbi:TfoX/Sxy family protein [Ruminococcus sp.]|uniref:TfoX/Sxy family protein n=1 Tax=Ruminococcus sp. TaxID=41978 RepID=UPI00386D8B86